jgi:glutaredoxin 3
MKKITIYSTPTCVFCPAVKKFLNDRNLTYEEIDVSKDPEALEEMKQKTGQMGVPVTVIGEEVVIGYDKKKLQKALDS